MGPNIPLIIQEPSYGGKPWVILIHGLGMSNRSWIDPLSENLLNGLLSFDYVLTDFYSFIPMAKVPYLKSLGCSPSLRLAKNPSSYPFVENLKKEGFGIITWSQRKPRGRMIHAIEELQTVLATISRKDKIVLIGHSRGGLIARKFLQEHRPGWDQVAGVIFLGVPNHGSRIAEWIAFLSANPFYRFIKAGRGEGDKTQQKQDYGSVMGVIRSLFGYARNEGVKELSPRSAFMRDLAIGEKEEERNKIPYFNLIGTRTEFIRFYKLDPLSASPPKVLFSLLDGLEKIFPRPLILPEIKKGKGDGQVSVNSAILSWAESNHLFPVNHAQFLVDERVQEKVKQILKIL